MPLPPGPFGRIIKSRREERLTVAQVIERLQQLPPYYPTTVVDVADVAPEGGYRVVEFIQ